MQSLLRVSPSASSAGHGTTYPMSIKSRVKYIYLSDAGSRNLPQQIAMAEFPFIHVLTFLSYISPLKVGRQEKVIRVWGNITLPSPSTKKINPYLFIYLAYIQLKGIQDKATLVLCALSFHRR